MILASFSEEVLARFTERITILSDKDIKELYGLPQLSEEDRELYFTMDTDELKITHSRRSLAAKLIFMLQLGYFKAKKMFFAFTYDEIHDDIQFIRAKYSLPDFPPKKFKIHKTTRWNQQRRILTLFNYHDCDALWRKKLKEKACRYVRISSKPICIFKDLLTYLEKARVVLPAYSTLQKIISETILEETNRLSAFAERTIPGDVASMLQELLTREDRPYMFTLMKKEPKDFKYKQISQEIAKQNLLRPLYDFAEGFLPRLNISNDNIRYYASLVDYYTAFRVKQLHDSSVANVYLLCFIYHRYQRINDNLVNTFIYHVRKHETAAKLVAKSSIYELKVEGNEQMKNVGKVLDLFMDEEIADQTPFGEVKNQAFGILEKDKFPLMAQYISGARFDQAELEWKALDELAPTFKKNLRPVFLSLDLKSTAKNDTLMNAVNFLKTKILEKKSLRGIKPNLFPLDFIRRKLKRYILEKRKVRINATSSKVLVVRPDRYEFLVYSLVRQNIESGDVYLRDSERFRSFEDDLISDKQWANKDQLIRELDLPILSRPIEETLAELKKELESLFINVNQRIKEGRNKDIKITGSGTSISWSLPYKKPEDTANNPLFEHLPQIEIRDLLSFVDGQCGFMGAFTHLLGRYVKNEAENDAVAGAVIALATNKGLFKMAESSNMAYQPLYSAMKNFLRLETLHNANDLISNALFNLPVFKHFNIVEGIVHSSSDGQKFETQIDTINARHSPKYFGLGKGVTAYTLVANNVPVNAKIIGANEHESHFVFDILYNNTSEIQSDRHSVDTHGTNNVNFLILHAFGYEFAPRYKDINGKSETLCGFEKLKHYEKLLIKPSRRVKEGAIIKEWPEIQRILVSLGVKSTTQSVIVGKLSSYTRKNRTKRAMWELDAIFRSIYLLKYIDNVVLRQNVQRALNRGESYHQLRRAISHEHFGKFRVETESEQNLWNECSRLVANAIIFYNTYSLNRLIDQMAGANKFDLVEGIKKVSPIAWRHVNLGGRFNLISQENPLDIDQMIARLENFLLKSDN
jgi:TnpA family transposase